MKCRCNIDSEVNPRARARSRWRGGGGLPPRSLLARLLLWRSTSDADRGERAALGGGRKMSERAGRARALPADVTHITSLLPHLDEQTVRRALTLHGNREAAIDALLTSPAAQLPRAPPPAKRRTRAAAAAKKRPVVAPPRVVEPPRPRRGRAAEGRAAAEGRPAAVQRRRRARQRRRRVMRWADGCGGADAAGGCRRPPTPDADADDASPAAAWVVSAEMADAEAERAGGGGAGGVPRARGGSGVVVGRRRQRRGGGRHALPATQRPGNAHISAQFAQAAVAQVSTAHPPPQQVQGRRPARPALHRVVQRQVPRHLPDGN